MPEPFAVYSPRRRREPPLAALAGMTIRPLRSQDSDAVASMRHERHGGEREEQLEWVRASIARREQVPDGLEIVVARCAARTVAYGCVVRLVRGALDPSNAIPTGLYLGGIIVRPDMRRRGIGRALTA